MVVSCRVHLTGGGSAGDVGVRFEGAHNKPVHTFRRSTRRPAGLVRPAVIEGSVFATNIGKAPISQDLWLRLVLDQFIMKKRHEHC
jgi:hypothetical protein